MSELPNPMESRQRGWRLFAKQCLDRGVATAVLAATAPALLGSMIAVRLTMGSPVIFSQERPGRRGRTFRIHKLRTMLDARDARGNLLSDEERLTGLGRFLRTTSLDELPQLWDVLRGELSLVGPRPLLMQYLSRYTPEQARRHDVLPGITGWAQVHGRNTLSWDEKFAMDLWYVRNWSLLLDLRILLLTVRQVLKRDGISNSGHATMPEFTGQAEGARSIRMNPEIAR